MASQSNDAEGALGCAAVVAAVFVVWLLVEAVTKLIEVVTAALQSFWQFLVWLLTEAWNAVVAAVSAFFSFLTQPLTITVLVGAVGAYLLAVGLKRHLASLDVTAGEDEALIIERWGRYLTTLYRGRHTLPLGAYVRRRLPLEPVSLASNEEELMTADHVGLRLRCTFDLHVTNARLAHYGRRKYAKQFCAVTHRALAREALGLHFAQFLAQPEEVNQALADHLNLTLGEWGLKVSDFRMEELTQPEELLRLRRSQRAGDYWEWNAAARQAVAAL
jgi:regulator of protease activity HflC (stomatin/prohibitin superfamily)